MNEENNKKRNKIIIIVAVLFLLTAGIITVYSFKDTKAEEVSAYEEVNSIDDICPTYLEPNKSGEKSGCHLEKGEALSSSSIGGFYGKRVITGSEIEFLNNVKVGQTISGTTTKYYTTGRTNQEYYIQKKEFKFNYNNQTLTANPMYYFTSPTGDSAQNSTKSCQNGLCCIIETSGPDWFSQYLDITNFTAYIDNRKQLLHFISKDDTFSDNTIRVHYTIKDFMNNGKLEYYVADYSWDKPTADDPWKFPTSCTFRYSVPMMKVTYNANGGLISSHLSSLTKTYMQKLTDYFDYDDDVVNENVIVPLIRPTKEGYIFKGWKAVDSNHDVRIINSGSSLKIKYNIPMIGGLCSEDGCIIDEVTLEAIWDEDDSSHPRQYTLTYLDSDGKNIKSVTDDLNTIEVISGSDSYCTGNYAGGKFQYWKNTDTSDTDKYGNCSDCNGAITITSGRNATLKAVCSSNSGGGNTPKYTLTLKKNCSGTFKCVSDTNSEVCNQLKNNGKFTKTIANGDTFTFPKTFDTLTCDGNEINSWGSFELGQELEIKSDITASAKWKSSSGGGDTPSTDEYTVTLKKNCSGTFVCSSSVNSEVCNQLKSNGKFTKNVTKGDTFIFPKTFDTLTCDGENIDKWGIYNLGSSITVNSNITASAKWKNSSSIDDPSDDPSDDPIDNPQTGSIVIYLVLLFGIGALAYSVWYFRGFRKN